MEQFYTILTNKGKTKLAAALANNTQVTLARMAVGDGGGAYYNPSESQTTLKRETYRSELGNLTTDADNPNYIVCEMTVPTQTGGFYIRETAIFDTAGDMIAIGKVPETYKPTLDTGSAKDLLIQMIIEVSNAAAVTISVNPSIVVATKEYADKTAANAVNAHVLQVNPHSQYVLGTTYNAGMAGKADKADIGDIASGAISAHVANSNPHSQYMTADALTGKADKIHGHTVADVAGVLPIDKGGTGNTEGAAVTACKLALANTHDWKTAVEYNYFAFNDADTVKYDIPDGHGFLIKYTFTGAAKCALFVDYGGNLYVNAIWDWSGIWQGWRKVLYTTDSIINAPMPPTNETWTKAVGKYRAGSGGGYCSDGHSQHESECQMNGGIWTYEPAQVFDGWFTPPNGTWAYLLYRSSGECYQGVAEGDTQIVAPNSYNETMNINLCWRIK